MAPSSSRTARCACWGPPRCCPSRGRGTVARGPRATVAEAGSEALTRSGAARRSFYYGWVSLGVAALAMVGTLPGRTQGLGLVTEPLMRDLGIGRVAFAEINLVATLVGPLFCLGIGRLIDRAGGRLVLTVVTAALGLVVLAMSRVATF